MTLHAFPAAYIHPLRPEDPERLSAAFMECNWHKSSALFQRYLQEQALGQRKCLVAEKAGTPVGYVTLLRHSEHPAFREEDIPEIADLNVIPRHHRQGIATALMDSVERIAARESQVVGLGCGLHPGYSAAQRLYVLRGYVPDGNGLSSRGRPVSVNQQVTVNDELLLHFVKQLVP